MSGSGTSITVSRDGITYVFGSVTTVDASTTLARITKVYYPNGKTLTLSYDSDNTLTTVQDNRNNSLSFERTYSSGLLSTQTALQKRLITAVVYTSGNDQQRTTIDYDNPSDAVYLLHKTTSPAYGSYTYQYSNIFRPSLYARDQKNHGSIASQSPYSLPTLTSITDAANNVLQKWEVSGVNYQWSTQINDFGTAQVTLTSYSPLDTVSSVAKTATTYDDFIGHIDMSITPRYGDATVSQTHVVFGSSSLPADPGAYNHTDLTVMDSADTSMTITGNYRCVSEASNTPIQAAKTNAYTTQVKETTDGNGNKTAYGYDSLNRVTSVVEAVDTPAAAPIHRTTTYTYGPLIGGVPNPYRSPTIVQGPYQTVTNTLNSRGQILSQITSSSQPNSITKTIFYHYNENSALPDYGLLHNYDGPRTDINDSTTYLYDNYGNLASKAVVVNNATGTPINRVQSYIDYNSAGLPKTINYPNGSTDTILYDDGYRVKQTTHSKGTVSQITKNVYNTLGRLTDATDADGFTTHYDYDVIGRLTKKTSPNGNTENYAFHPNGSPYSTIQKNADGTIAGSQWSDIDGTGNVATVTSGGSTTKQTTTMLYDANNNVKQTTTSEGIVNKWEYDALNRVVNHTDGNGKVDYKDYDSVDNEKLTKASNATKSDRTFINQSLIQQEINVDYGTTTYAYDVAENLTGTTHSNRVCSRTQIDQLGRPKAASCTLTGATDPTYQANNLYTFDPATDNLNEVDSQITKGVNTVYGYDALGRLTSKAQHSKTIEAQGYNSTLSNGYSYTSAGKLTQFTYPSGNVISYSYDAADGDLNGIQINNTQTIARNMTFDGAGRFRVLYWGASGAAKFGVVTNDGGEVTTVLNTNSAGANTFYASNIYDLDGRLKSQNYSLTSTSESYTYDGNSQLLTDTINGSLISYVYDILGNGNRTSLTAASGSGLSYTSQALTYVGNRLDTWKKNGTSQPLSVYSLGEIGSTYKGTYGYDAAGRHRTETTASSVSMYMDYNHKNERTLRLGNSQDRQYAYDESSHLIGEYTLSGSLIVEYIWLGDRPIAAVYPGNRIVYIVSDHQNKPRRGIDASTQQVVWSWDPDAFGAIQPQAGLANPATINLRFPGQYYDSQSGLYYNHNRFYNPELGRYMEPDPTGLDSGLNPYAYVGNNPVNGVDPTGLMEGMSDWGMSNVWINGNINLNAMSGIDAFNRNMMNGGSGLWAGTTIYTNSNVGTSTSYSQHPNGADIYTQNAGSVITREPLTPPVYTTNNYNAPPDFLAGTNAFPPGDNGSEYNPMKGTAREQVVADVGRAVADHIADNSPVVQGALAVQAEANGNTQPLNNIAIHKVEKALKIETPIKAICIAGAKAGMFYC
jgi:RHS repeat-associated protein